MHAFQMDRWIVWKIFTRGDANAAYTFSWHVDEAQCASQGCEQRNPQSQSEKYSLEPKWLRMVQDLLVQNWDIVDIWPLAFAFTTHVWLAGWISPS